MTRLFDRAPAPAQITVLLAALVSTGLLASGRQAPVIPVPPVADETSVVPLVSAPAGLPSNLALGQLSPDLLARPLVVDGRRPETDLAATPDQTPDDVDVPMSQPVLAPPPVLRYKGFTREGAGPRALIAWGPGDAQDEWLDVGYERDGWRIAAIKRDRLTLTNGTEELSFGLFEAD